MSDISDSVVYLETVWNHVIQFMEEVLWWTWCICCAAGIKQGKEQKARGCLKKGTSQTNPC